MEYTVVLPIIFAAAWQGGGEGMSWMVMVGGGAEEGGGRGASLIPLSASITLWTVSNHTYAIKYLKRW